MATITENLKTIKDSTMAIKQAIIDKGGEVGDLTTYAEAIANLPIGGGDTNPTAEKNAVTFYDYDGTIRYSYTAEEFLALTEMPPLPRQQGLICQEWNWSFEDAREYVAEYGVLDVGATYITDDGKTRLYIRIAAKGRMDVPLYFQQTIANGVTIDWGDGTPTETLDGTGEVNTTHRYASIGDYMISLDVADGCTLGLGHNSSSYCVLGSTGNNNKVYCNMLQKVEMGVRTRFYLSAFQNCYSLKTITMPEHIESIVSSVFLACNALASIVIPQKIKSIEVSAFYSSNAISTIILPNNLKNIRVRVLGSNALRSVVIPGLATQVILDGCNSLSSVIMPKGVTNIPSNGFLSCYGLAYIDFSHHTAVPTLANTNAFMDIPSDCKIIVPDNLYDEWIAATNWSTYASYIIKKIDWDASINNQ